jgi:hypothetical protein
MFRIFSFLTLFSFSLSFGAEYEGLVLLKRYVAKIATTNLCDTSRLPFDKSSISMLPTDKSINVFNYILESNGSAIIFDFESPSLGLGNCLLGFLQTFHWAALSGRTLFIAKPTKGTANALCWFFECGFPVIDVADLDKVGARR